MSQRIPKLPTLVNGTRRLRRTVRRHSAREAEALEHPLQTLFILRNFRIDVGIGAVEPVVGDEEVTAMARSGQKDHVEVIPLDHPIAMNEDKVLSRDGAPVSDNLVLDHVTGQRLFQQRIVEEVELSSREIVGRHPVFIHLRKK